MGKKSQPMFLDFLLIPGFILTAISGLNLHVVHKTLNGNIWGFGFHDWMTIHITIALSFLVLSIVHIYQHWTWFSQLFRSAKNKSKITIIMAILFLAVSITGLISMLIEHSHIGLLHAKLGEFMIIIGVVHFASRFKILLNMFKRRTIKIKEVQQT